tara:strand:- start:8803 stop:11697 length:2895 start_codon:yes stop_codon:yes gene_type:complete
VRIDRIHIDGFGVFHDKGVAGFQKGINVLYGPNEAGKSTLLDFIRFTLFEYPRFKDERRPPLSGGTHGGRLFLRDSGDQPFSIYRKGDGKTALFEQNDRESNNLSTYRQLIGNASNDLYKNVYAITLDELLHVDQLSDSGMEDRIFSMGMGLAGVDFGKFEKGLINHADDFYKARGSTQVLVNLVDQINEKESAIRELRGKLDDYDRLSAKKEELESSLSKIKRSRETLSAEKNKYADLSRAYESYVIYQTVSDDLKSLGKVDPIPDKLKEEIEACSEDIRSIEASRSKLARSLEQISESIESIEWNESLAPHVYLLDFFKTNVKLYEEARNSIVQQKDKQNSLARSSEQIIQKLGNELKKDELLKIEGTFELRSFASDIEDKKQQLQRKSESRKEELKRIENEVRRYEEQLNSTVDQFKKMRVKNDEDREKLANRKTDLDTKFQKALQNPGKKDSTNIPLMLAFVFVVMGGALFALHTLSAAIVLGISLLNLIVVLLRRPRGGSGIQGMDANSINREIEELKSALVMYDDLKQTSEKLQLELKQLKDDEQRVQLEVDELNREIQKLNESWELELSSKNLPSDIPPNRFSDFLTNIDELKRLENDLKETEKTILRNDEMIGRFEDKLRSVLPSIERIDSSVPHDLIKTLAKQEKSQEKRDQLKEQEEEQKRELKSLDSSLEELLEINKKRLSEANSTSLSDFHESIERQKKWEEFKSRQDNAVNTIKTICGADQLEETLNTLGDFTPSELNTKKENTENEYEAVKQQYDELNRELATIKTEIRHILEPDEMYALQNEKESLQEQLKEQTKEWLSTKMALEVLNESKQRYENERQPEVITQTRKYFKAITENAYEDLRISLSDRHVSIIDDRGRQKSVEELSRGTREQLLLALRLGLIEEYEKNAEPLPVALDDIMVNFDIHRSKNLVKVLTDFASDRQVILFTCHEHTRDLFKNEGATIIDWRN